MASNKFFTWTKGDRKQVSNDLLRTGGIVPIPAECITIKGVDYGQNAKTSRKANRKPLPLSFDQTSSLTATHSARTSDSLALQDAAVQSATSLMAVMNDMLRSPHLSAHLASQQRPHGRSRSYTAPTTPMVEAPFVQPAELPGSSPSWPTHASSTRLSTEPRTIQPDSSVFTSAALGEPMSRPHSSPQESSNTLSVYPRHSSESFSRSVINLHPPADPVPRAKTSSPYRPRRPLERSPFTVSDENSTAAEGDFKRPTPAVLQSWLSKSPSLAGSQTMSRAGSSYVVPHKPSTPGFGSFLDNQVQSMDSEVALLEQISLMRAEHEAHLQSLKEAHAREIASHQSYVSFLERRKGLLPSIASVSKQALTIDTSQVVGKGSEQLQSEPSASGSLQSFEASLESQKRVSAEAAAAEIEALKRKLSLSRKAQAELSTIRQERDHLRDTAERSDRRIIQLKDIVRRAKENDKALRNAVRSLEDRLVAANNERTDVLEGYHEAFEQARALVDREQCLARERDDLRTRLFYADPQWLESGLATGNDSYHEKAPQPQELDTKRATLRSDPLLQQLDELRQMVAERDSKLRDLMQQSLGNTSDATPRTDTTINDQSDVITELEHQLTDCRRALSRANDDRDRYNSLLHAELRRQSRQAAQKPHATISHVASQASDEVAQRLNSLQSGSQTGSPPSLDATRQFLERELSHCLSEIIMYKLDIKGYKKDLRQAQAIIDGLQAAAYQRPLTPDSSSKTATQIESRLPTPGTQGDTFVDDSSGLGISLPALPNTQTQTIESATVAALLSMTPTPQPRPSTLSSTPARPKTPLGTHKRLPKPPSASRTPSPSAMHISTPPQVPVLRAEAARSLSESIISSYALRSTPNVGTPATRGRNSEPVGQSFSPRVATRSVTAKSEDSSHGHDVVQSK